MKPLIPVLLALGLATPALADGDAEKGARDFGKCKTCHAIASAEEVIVKGGKVGPNLYGVVGRQVAADPDFNYGASIRAVGEAGTHWDEENLVAYLADPTAWVKEATGDPGARSKMTFKLKDGEDVVAYLASLAPPPESGGDDDDDGDDD